MLWAAGQAGLEKLCVVSGGARYATEADDGDFPVGFGPMDHWGKQLISTCGAQKDGVLALADPVPSGRHVFMGFPRVFSQERLFVLAWFRWSASVLVANPLENGHVGS